MSGSLHPTYGALPWYAKGGEIYARDGEIIAQVFSMPDPAEAQAREQKIAALIAAAPMLVQALQFAEGAFGKEADKYGSPHECQAVNIIRAALNATTGTI